MAERHAMQRLLLAGILACAAVGAVRPAAARVGLATGFVEVLAEGVPLASRWTMDGKLVDVKNSGDEPTTIRFDAESPSPGLLRPGCEPIPDPAWISFEPRTVEVGPGETKSVRLVMYTPDDASLSGRRFQAMIRIRPTATTGAVAVAAGLLPRFMFTLGPKTGGAEAVKIVNHPPKLASVRPYSSGGRARELIVECEPVSIENFLDQAVTYEFVSEPDEAARKAVEMRPGDEPLDPAWVQVSPRTVLLQRRKMTPVSVQVRIPLSINPFGRRFAGPLLWKAVRADGSTVRVQNMVRVVADPLPGATGFATTGGGK